jgi:hypothetical protein
MLKWHNLVAYSCDTAKVFFHLPNAFLRYTYLLIYICVFSFSYSINVSPMLLRWVSTFAIILFARIYIIQVFLCHPTSLNLCVESDLPDSNASIRPRARKLANLPITLDPQD